MVFGWLYLFCKNISRLVEIKQIERPAFDSKQEAERHGLELARKWVDALAASQLVMWTNEATAAAKKSYVV